MKKEALIFGILILLFGRAVAQATNDSDPLNGVDTVQMAKFVGRWEWKSKNSSFTLVLRKVKAGVIPLVSGDYRFVENGIVVINTLDGVNKRKDPGMMGYAQKDNDSLQMLLSDLTRGIQRHGTINFVKGEKNKILLKFPIEKKPKTLNHLSFGPVQKQVFRGKIPNDLKLVLTRTE